MPAAAQQKGIGIGSESDDQWDYREIINGNEITPVQKRFVQKSAAVKCQVRPNLASGTVTLHFSVPTGLRRDSIVVTFYSQGGEKILRERLVPNARQYTWHFKDSLEKPVAGGNYLYEVLAYGVIGTGTIQVRR